MASPSSLTEPMPPPAEGPWIRQSCEFYACPVCKQNLETVHDGLLCRGCARTYPIVSGIPDFTVVNFAESNNFDMRMLAKRDSGALLNFAASVYETWIYPVVCNLLCGVGHSLMRSTIHVVAPSEFKTWLARQTSAPSGTS